MKLAAIVVECGTRRGAGPYRLSISQRSLHAVTPEGVLSETDLSESRLLTFTPARVARRSPSAG